MWRVKIAGRFGRLEHAGGIWLGVWTIINALDKQTAWSYLGFTIWVIYFIAHRLEKLSYGKYGTRNQR